MWARYKLKSNYFDVYLDKVEAGEKTCINYMMEMTTQLPAMTMSTDTLWETLESMEEFGDEEAQAVIKKVVKGNREMIAVAKDPEVVQRTETEIALLNGLLPQTLTVEEITQHLAPVQDAIRAAGNDGQATGVAMKHLKSGGHAVEGQSVAQAVKALRAG